MSPLYTMTGIISQFQSITVDSNAVDSSKASLLPPIPSILKDEDGSKSNRTKSDTLDSCSTVPPANLSPDDFVKHQQAIHFLWWLGVTMRVKTLENHGAFEG